MDLDRSDSSGLDQFWFFKLVLQFSGKETPIGSRISAVVKPLSAMNESPGSSFCRMSHFSVSSRSDIVPP